MDIIKKIAEELQIRPDQVKAVVNLIDEGNTIPFIARYRKEAHGALNDEILRNLDERLTYLRNLEEKKSSVLASMEEDLGVLAAQLDDAVGAGGQPVGGHTGGKDLLHEGDLAAVSQAHTGGAGDG